MKLTEMRQILAERRILLTKSLGQNFLHDGNQLRRIVASAELTAQDRVLEIGPGLGPLTGLLLEQAGQVMAIEKDRRLAGFLNERFAKAKGLTLIVDDALDYVRRAPMDWSHWKVVANLPYSVASPLIVDLAQSTGRPERMVITLQQEVARRLVAPPESAGYGVLTLLIQLHYEPRGGFKIPAGCFFPPPEVDSSCVTLLRRTRPLLAPHQAGAFSRIVKRGFSQRRKMMFKLLKCDWRDDLLSHAFANAGLTPSQRAETVSVEQFAELARALEP